MKTANCPQCGAQVKFHAAASVLAVCEYCTSTLMRHGDVLEHIGKMAELQDDPSLIQIGTEGVYRGIHFGVIGRIQMRYEAGLWNEWHLMFDDMRTGWLGEAAGEFNVSFEQKVELAPPPFEAIKVDDKIDIGGRYFSVTNLESATCIAGQGELPFSVGPGYAAPVVDLALEGEFATIDYSDVEEGLTRVFVGKRVPVRDLKLTNLRDPKAAPGALSPTAKAEAFNCPSCAAPFTLSSGKIQTYGCASCGAVLDTTERKVQLVQQAQEAMSYPLRIPLGAKGKLDSIEWELIGHVRRASSGGFSWSEYLLFNPTEGYAWLSESDGHWSFLRNAGKPYKVIGLSAYYNGAEHEHFAHYTSEVQHVLGEFYWRIRAGDKADVDDYIAPPQIASREKTAREVSWTAGRYLPVEELTRAFNIRTPMPVARGIAPNQPSPHAGTLPLLWKRFAWLSLAALIVQLWFALTTNAVLKDSLVLAPRGESVKTTAPFPVAGSGPLVVASSTTLNNSWAGLGLTLVEPASGKTWYAEQQIEYYTGYDEDGSWSEGSRNGQVVFADVPAGTYQLQVEGETDPFSKESVGVRFSVERGHASWLNWLLMQLLLLLLPLFAWWRARSFEVARWADSDHPKSSTSDEDDDD